MIGQFGRFQSLHLGPNHLTIFKFLIAEIFFFIDTMLFLIILASVWCKERSKAGKKRTSVFVRVVTLGSLRKRYHGGTNIVNFLYAFRNVTQYLAVCYKEIYI